jgi:hypothetical protein
MNEDPRPFRNGNLFFNHYLEKPAKDNPERREAESDDAFAAVNDIFPRKARVLENSNESWLDESPIGLILCGEKNREQIELCSLTVSRG